jgi:hypothetical protein
MATVETNNFNSSINYKNKYNLKIFYKENADFPCIKSDLTCDSDTNNSNNSNNMNNYYSKKLPLKITQDSNRLTINLANNFANQNQINVTKYSENHLKNSYLNLNQNPVGKATTTTKATTDKLNNISQTNKLQTSHGEVK